MSCLRRLENVKWYHHVRNSTIRQQTKQHPVSITLTQRRLRWFGHLQRMPPESEVLKLHNFSPGTIGWTRPRGRPRRRWLDCISQDLAVIDLPLAEAVRIDLTRFNKIATQGAPQMAVDKEANSLSRVYSYYSKFNLRLFYV